MEIATRIAQDTEREFRSARVEVEEAALDPGGDGDADAYLWLESNAEGEEEAEELWDWVRFACSQAWEKDDVRIVWRWKRNRSGTLEHDDQS
jgi:hypothetical protein